MSDFSNKRDFDGTLIRQVGAILDGVYFEGETRGHRIYEVVDEATNTTRTDRIRQARKRGSAADRDKLSAACEMSRLFAFYRRCDEAEVTA